MSVRIYGASDDLIEVDGDIYEDFNPSHDDEASYLAFADGTVIRVTYDGQWHISRLAEGAAEYAHDAATSIDGEPRKDGSPSYSDRVTLTGLGDLPIAWVVFGTSYAEAK